MNLANFKEILEVVSNLAMKGCLFLGELPAWLAEAEGGVKVVDFYNLYIGRNAASFLFFDFCYFITCSLKETFAPFLT